VRNCARQFLEIAAELAEASSGFSQLDDAHWSGAAAGES